MDGLLTEMQYRNVPPFLNRSSLVVKSVHGSSPHLLHSSFIVLLGNEYVFFVTYFVLLRVPTCGPIVVNNVLYVRINIFSC